MSGLVIYIITVVKTAQESLKKFVKIYLIRYKTYRLVFDQRTHGEVDGRFTSDIDTILGKLFKYKFCNVDSKFYNDVGTS